MRIPSNHCPRTLGRYNGAVTIDPNRTSLFQLSPDYHAPYGINPQVSVTQQLPGAVRLSVQYRLSYGYRQQRTRNINAPFPGTPLSNDILDLPREVRRDTVDRMRPFLLSQRRKHLPD